MPGIVQQLPDHVANQIAAGEVVERPASVVKELVENSLDAGATRIRLEIEDGGKRLIRIIDNGCGMNSEDALMCLQRHATSKITDAADLNSIATLGFRGEALPSIQSVSRFKLRTRRHDELEGTQVVAEGKNAPQVSPVGCPAGTDIEVRDLFFNVPARRKFLRRAGTEISRIGDIMDRFALAWPGVSFSMTHNSRRNLEYPADRNLRARVLAVLGRSVVSQLHPVRLTMGNQEVFGLTSEPTLHRPNNRSIYTLVNGRFVRDRVLQHAVVRAYDNLLDNGRYPVTILSITVAPEDVDINVHPTKSEVRFADSGSVHSLIERALRLTLVDTPWADREHIINRSEYQTATPGDLFSTSQNSPQDSQSSVEISTSIPVDTEELKIKPEQQGVHNEPKPQRPDERGFFASFNYVGQVLHRFLICETNQSMYIIDQHRADQCRLFNLLYRAHSKQSVETQLLMFPVRIKLSDNQAETAQSYTGKIEELGYIMEHFGGNDWVIKEVPELLNHVDPADIIYKIIDALPPVGTPKKEDVLNKQLITLMASSAAIQGGDKLSTDDATKLMRSLDGLPLEPNSTHDGPLLRRFSAEDMNLLLRQK